MVIGPQEHGVTAYALDLCRALHIKPLRFETWQDLESALPLSVDSEALHLCFTDYLWGETPQDAVALVRRLSEQFYLSISFHDVPQPQEGQERFAARAQAYAALGGRADVLVVNSQHEAAFFTQHCVAQVHPVVLPLPLPPKTVPPKTETANAQQPNSKLAGDSVSENSSAPREPLEIGVMGFVYPGKGHEELLQSIAGMNANVRALGGFSAGHDWLQSHLQDIAHTSGVGFEITGYLSEEELQAQMMCTEVPICAHRHFSASGSLMKWISLGRKVLVSDSPYSRELAQIWGDFIVLVSDNQWAQALCELPADFSRPLPAPTNWTWEHLANGYRKAWGCGALGGISPQEILRDQPTRWPSVSVVIPYFENPAGLHAILQALENQDYAGAMECVIADDGSAQAPQIPTTSFPVTVVRQEDRGFRAAAARNLGARAATGEVLAFLDGDTVPCSQYLRHAVALITQVPNVLVVGTRVHADGKEPQWLRDAWADTNHLADADDSSWRFVISAVLTCSRSFFEQVGGFDETMVGYGGEDWEFAWRSWNRGALLWHCEQAIADHPGGDWGARTEHDAGAIAQKNRESVMVAQRISHPMARPDHVVFESADIDVVLPQDAAAWSDGVGEAVIAGWLKLSGVHVLAPEGSYDRKLYSGDSRVHCVAVDGSCEHQKLHKTARLQVFLEQPAAPYSLEGIYSAQEVGGHAMLIDAVNDTPLAHVVSARLRNLRMQAARASFVPGEASQEDGPRGRLSSEKSVEQPLPGGRQQKLRTNGEWTIFTQPARLEALFAGW